MNKEFELLEELEKYFGKDEENPDFLKDHYTEALEVMHHTKCKDDLRNLIDIQEKLQVRVSYDFYKFVKEQFYGSLQDADTEILSAYLYEYATGEFKPDMEPTHHDMYNYGYKNYEMTPISRIKAYELLQYKKQVYILYPDGTERILTSSDDIKYELMYGIQKSDIDAKLIKQAIERLDELEESLYGGSERPKDSVDCGIIDGEYNTWIAILDHFKIPHHYSKQY